MVGVEERAERWVAKSHETVYAGFYQPLLERSRVARDSAQRLPSDSWRLSLEFSSSFDTVTVLGFSRNVHRRWIAQQDTIYGNFYGDLYVTAPLYSLPLALYGSFLDPSEQARLRLLIDATLKKCLTDQRIIDSVEVNSIAWVFKEHNDWNLLDPDRFEPMLTNSCWSGTYNVLTAYPIPKKENELSGRELYELFNRSDTKYLQTPDGQREPFVMSVRRTPSALELQLTFTPVKPTKRAGHNAAPYSSYALSTDFVGLSFEGSPSECWVDKVALCSCYGLSPVLGFLEAYRTNVIRSLVMHPTHEP